MWYCGVLLVMIYIIMVLWCVICDGFYNSCTVVCFGDDLYYHGAMVCYL